MRTIFAFIVALALFADPGNAKEIPNSSFRIGLWTISAYTDDATGNFSHCVADVPYKSGVTLSFSISEAGSSWRMALSNPSWNLPSGARYPISYTIDGLSPVSDTAIAVLPQMIMWELPPTTGLFQLFQKGRLLTVGAAGGSFAFDLSNSSRALSMALGCAGHYRNNTAAHVDPSNPFAPSGVPDATRAEATTVLANLLGAAEIKGFRLLTDIPPQLATVHAAYEAPGVTGGLRISTGTTVPDVAAEILVLDEKACSGSYASTRERSQGSVVSILSACKSSDGGIGIMYVLAPRSAGGVYVFSAIQYMDAGSAAPPQAIEDAGRGIFEATIRTLR